MRRTIRRNRTRADSRLAGAPAVAADVPVSVPHRSYRRRVLGFWEKLSEWQKFDVVFYTVAIGTATYFTWMYIFQPYKFSVGQTVTIKLVNETGKITAAKKGLVSNEYQINSSTSWIPEGDLSA